MAVTKIEWTATVGPDGTVTPGYTFNPWRGCTKVSPGCANCYADTLSGRNPKTLGVWGPKGTRVVAAESMWREPVKWDRAAKSAGERHRVFCASLADVFEEWAGPMADAHGNRLRLATDGRNPPWYAESPCDEKPGRFVRMDDVRARLFRLIDDTPNLDWLLLTKRPENVARMTPVFPIERRTDESNPARPNVWLGASVEDQRRADERIPHLLRTPAAVRFLSVEPLLGPVDLTRWLYSDYDLAAMDRQLLTPAGGFTHAKVGWVIVGGESGPGARPCNVEWVRSVVGQCREAGTACFVKQLGAVPTSPTKLDGWPDHVEYRKDDGPTNRIRLADGKGGDPREWPDDLRVREFPG